MRAAARISSLANVKHACKPFLHASVSRGVVAIILPPLHLSLYYARNLLSAVSCDYFISTNLIQG